MTHDEKVARWLKPLRKAGGSRPALDFGVEVGAFETPIPGIRPFYVDRFAEYGGKHVRADYWGDLTALPFRANSLDYVAASHVLEHVANPVKALWECARVLRHDGIAYLVVPDRRFTFDHTRPLTPAEHMLSDFDRGVTDCDGTHLSDYLDGLDWARWNPNATVAENVETKQKLRAIYKADLAAGREINIHFHTFESANVTQLIALMNRRPDRPCELEIVDHAERFPEGRHDGVLFVLRAHKRLADRLAGKMLRIRSAGHAAHALRAGAKRFDVPSTAKSLATETIVTAVRPSDEPGIRACIDTPTPSDVCDPLCFRVEGWIHTPSPHPPEVQLWLGDTCVGTTGRFFTRHDVNEALHLPAATCAGFRILAHAPQVASGENTLALRVRLAEAAEAIPVLTKSIRFAKHDHRRESFGILLESNTVGIMRREHMYTTGPSRGEGSVEVLGLLTQYLPPPPGRVADVGCGLGWYGRELRSRGYDWMGLEVKPEDCAALAAQGMPYRQVDGRTLPFPDGHFDAAISIEVLEHLDDPRSFLHEVHRVSPRMLLVSVPNAELVPYLHPYLATPRHMLDSDHRSFFTRWSLGSLLREFYPHAEVLLHSRHPLNSVDGTPLFYNLFAIAWS